MYKLYYFNGRGRGEFIRYMFAYANVPFDDVKITENEWFSRMKDEMPLGILPVLELPDRRQLSQSLAIGRYLAKKFGLECDDDYENAFAEQFACTIEDVYPIYYREYVMCTLHINQERKLIAIDEMKSKALEPMFGRFEHFLGDKEWFCGNKIHWFDLMNAEFVERIESKIDADFVKKFPKLLAHSRRVHEIPNIKEYVEKRNDYGM